MERKAKWKNKELDYWYKVVLLGKQKMWLGYEWCNRRMKENCYALMTLHCSALSTVLRVVPNTKSLSLFPSLHTPPFSYVISLSFLISSQSFFFYIYFILKHCDIKIYYNILIKFIISLLSHVNNMLSKI